MVTIKLAGKEYRIRSDANEEWLQRVASYVDEAMQNIRERTDKARQLQTARGYPNARMPSNMIREFCKLDEAGEKTLEMAMQRMGLSARAHDRILKVSRTIADLGGHSSIAVSHLAEAVQYRSLDRTYWT